MASVEGSYRLGVAKWGRIELRSRPLDGPCRTILRPQKITAGLNSHPQ